LGKRCELCGRPRAARVDLEKLPLLAMSAAVSALVVLAQGRAVASIEQFPLDQRISNALVSYLRYIGKALWPSDLAIFYPHPQDTLALWRVAASGIALLFASGLALRWARRFPFFTVGWLWYLGTLVPVIGLVQVGAQAMADRYTYLPLVGLSLMVAWGVPELLERLPRRRAVLVSLGAISVAGMAFASWIQLGHWKSGVTLFEHTIASTGHNDTAWFELSKALEAEGRHEEQVSAMAHALEVQPGSALLQFGMGSAMAASGDPDRAILHYSNALRIHPTYLAAHNNLGSVLIKRGEIDGAIAHFERAHRIAPDYAPALFNLGVAMLAKGRPGEALVYLSRYETLEPRDPRVQRQMGRAHARLGRELWAVGLEAEAIDHLKDALRREPDPDVANDLAWMLATATDSSLRDAAEAVRLALDAGGGVGETDPALLDTLAAAYAAAGRFDDAVRSSTRAAELAAARGEVSLADEVRARVALYEARQIYVTNRGEQPRPPGLESGSADPRPQR